METTVKQLGFNSSGYRRDNGVPEARPCTNKARIVLPKLGTDTREWTSHEQGCLSLSCPRPEHRIKQIMGWEFQQ